MTENEYRAAMDKYRIAVESELKRIASREEGRIHPTLSSAMFYSVDVGGKRIRPCLLLAVCELFSGNAKDALPFACALEMIHTYSLIHDDLPCIDNDDMRRGKPSNHKVFGEGMSVFAGCGLNTLAFEIMLDACIGSGDPGQLLAMREIAARSGAHGMLSGQAADIECEGKKDLTPDDLHYIHEHKTADMLTAAVLAGAYIAHADEGSLSALREYSEKLGLLFQLRDDLLDVQGDPALMGKTLGKDAASGKLTYVTLLGVEGAREAAKSAADEALCAVKGIKNRGILEAAIRDFLLRSR